MPSGYLVDLGNTILDSGDGITLSYRQFTTDSVIGVGTWVWSGSKGKTTYTDVEETGVYYLAANGSVYFVPDGGRVNHADTATTGTVPSYIQSDGIISGTTSADVIDSNYSDQDGDSVDLGFGSGPNGFGDSIEAGAGDDTISAGQGDDTIFGQAGADVIDGGAGNDTIYGQDGADDLSGGDGDDEIHGGSAPVSAASEFLSWSSEGADDTDISSGFTQNTGTMNVTINFADSGNALAMQVESVDTTYVASGESFDPNSNLFLAGSGSGDTVITTLTFDADPSGGMTDEVENVSFRLNDIDAASGSWQDIISISALDADGNAVGVTITADGNDLVSGDTITGAESTDSEASVDGSALVTIAGPVHSVSIVYANGQTSTQTLWVSDVHFDTIPGAGDTSGNTLSGDAGADTLYGGAGNDTLTGGTEADSLYGGSGDDAFYLAQGDSAWGGLGDDVFVISDTGETNTTTITIDGEEDSASIGDTLDLNKLVDRNTLSYTDDGTGSYSGTAQLFSGATLNFSNIENIICFTPGTMIETARGPIAVEDLNEGDLLSTVDDGFQPVRWIGRRSVEATGKLAPITFAPGTLPGLTRPLSVSPQHRVLMSGYLCELLFGQKEVLVAAKHLLGLPGVTQTPLKVVTYIHLLMDRHQILVSNGAETESYHLSEGGLEAVSLRCQARLFKTFPHLQNDPDAYGATARPCLRAHEARLLADALIGSDLPLAA